jgi:hypothetical protein
MGNEAALCRIIEVKEKANIDRIVIFISQPGAKLTIKE